MFTVEWYRVLDMFVDSSARETRVSSVDAHPVGISLSGLPRTSHQKDLTAVPGCAGLVALHPQSRVVAPPASGSQDLPGELKTDV